MKNRLDYTTGARKFAVQHPMLSNAFTQAGFWVVAYMLLSFIIHFASSSQFLAKSRNDIATMNKLLQFIVCHWKIVIRQSKIVN